MINSELFQGLGLQFIIFKTFFKERQKTDYA